MGENGLHAAKTHYHWGTQEKKINFSLSRNELISSDKSHGFTISEYILYIWSATDL